MGKSERLFQFESSGDLMSTTLLLIAHGLLAVALLGAVTHQAVSVWLPMHEPANSFVGRVRGVRGVLCERHHHSVREHGDPGRSFYLS